MAKTKTKTTKPKKFFNAFLLSLAASTGWAAMHSPVRFDNPGIIGAWLISALAVGLLVRAALALLTPIMQLIADAVRHFFYHTNDGGNV